MNATSTAGALSSLLSPLEPEAFLVRHLSRRWHLCESAAPAPLNDLLDWRRLEDMLSSMRVDARRVTLLKAGTAIAPDHYLTQATGLGDRHVIASVVNEELRGGATLLVGAVDEWLPTLGQLAR